LRPLLLALSNQQLDWIGVEICYCVYVAVTAGHTAVGSIKIN